MIILYFEKITFFILLFRTFWAKNRNTHIISLFFESNVDIEGFFEKSVE